MSMFRRKRSAEATQVIDHLVHATIRDYLEGSDDSAKHAAQHIAADLHGLTRHSLERVAGLLIITAAQQSAVAIESGAMGVIRDLLRGEGPGQAQEPADGPGAPTDLLEDHEPTTGPQTDAEGEKVWPEDRR